VPGIREFPAKHQDVFGRDKPSHDEFMVLLEVILL
jgi:hypothetical protein